MRIRYHWPTCYPDALLASTLMALLIGVPATVPSSDFAAQQQLVDKARLSRSICRRCGWTSKAEILNDVVPIIGHPEPILLCLHVRRFCMEVCGLRILG